MDLQLLLQIEPFEYWGVFIEKGFNVFLLAIAIWYFRKENIAQKDQINGLHVKFENLQKEVIKYEREDKDRLLKIIQESTKAFEDLSQILQKIIIN